MKTIRTSSKESENARAIQPKLRGFMVLSLLLALLASSGNLFSQKKFEYGFYLGTSFTSLSGVDAMATVMSDSVSARINMNFPVDTKSRGLLFNAGGFVMYNFKNWLGLKAGIEYAPKGEKFKGEAYLSTDLATMKSKVLRQETVLKFGYLEFPIAVQLSTRSKDKPNKLFFYGNLGITPAVKLFSNYDCATQLVETGFDSQGETPEVILEKSYVEGEVTGVSGFDLNITGSAGISLGPGKTLSI